MLWLDLLVGFDLYDFVVVEEEILEDRECSLRTGKVQRSSTTESEKSNNPCGMRSMGSNKSRGAPVVGLGGLTLPSEGMELFLLEFA